MRSPRPAHRSNLAVLAAGVLSMFPMARACAVDETAPIPNAVSGSAPGQKALAVTGDLTHAPDLFSDAATAARP